MGATESGRASCTPKTQDYARLKHPPPQTLISNLQVEALIQTVEFDELLPSDLEFVRSSWPSITYRIEYSGAMQFNFVCVKE